MAYPICATTISSGVTVVECQKQVRSWHLLRSLIQALIPCCNGTYFEDPHHHHHHHQTKQPYFYYPGPPNSTDSIITGTIFGYRKGKVSFYIQTRKNPILLLELAVSTQTLAREMRGGFLRIVLESTNNNYAYKYSSSNDNEPSGLLSMPVWTMHCNGRRVGYAIKRQPTEADLKALRLMGSVAVGTGVIRGKDLFPNAEGRSGDGDCGDELMYLRAKFSRVCGSANSESFHLIDPDRCCIGQELSVFFFRSR